MNEYVFKNSILISKRDINPEIKNFKKEKLVIFYYYLGIVLYH